MDESEHLISMANQIAANFRFHDDCVERIADHIRRFWAPSMRQMLLERVDSQAPKLDAAVVEAVRELRD
ncbi:formate dehydrogenase subunit delta [Elongatibacter sediminis]|uniref:Formate dehydrogenase subunit delta n=1 Tax=Elongatibacter sediminis TaxID=3119006 RepID=A0AAW9RIK9_9GAMM